RHRADGARAVEQAPRHLDELVLHLLEARERHRVEQIRARVRRVSGAQQLLVFLAGVVDEREHAPAAPVGVAGAASGRVVEDGRCIAAALRDGLHSLASTEAVKMLLAPLPRMFDGGAVIELSICGMSYQ